MGGTSSVGAGRDALGSEILDAGNLQKALAVAALAGALAALGPFRIIWVLILAFALNFTFHYLRDAIIDPDQLRAKSLAAYPTPREIILQQLDGLPETKAQAKHVTNDIFAEDHVSLGTPGHGRAALDVGAQLEQPLDWACSLVIRDFVCWWYDPLANEDSQFPRQCRSVLNSFLNHVTRSMRDKNAHELLLSTIVSSTNTLLVYLSEFRLFKMSAAATSLEDYLEANPLSALARLADREHQLGSLRNTSTGLLETHMNAAHHPLILIIFREMFANQVLWKTIETISQPDWLNKKIVEIFRQNESDPRTHAKDAGVSLDAPSQEEATLDIDEPSAVASTTTSEENLTEQSSMERIQRTLQMYEEDRPRATDLSHQLAALPDFETDLSSEERQLQRTLAERGDDFFDFNTMIELPQDKALLHLYSQITTFRDVTAMMDPGPDVTRDDALVIFRTHFRQSTDGSFVDLGTQYSEGILRSIMLSPSKDVFAPVECLALQKLTEGYWLSFQDYKDKQVRNANMESKQNGTHGYSMDLSRPYGTSESDASSSNTSITPVSLNLQDVQVSVTDISPDVDPMKPIFSKKDLEFMVAVEGLDGPMAPGFITMRKWIDLEQLDGALQKTLPRSTTSVGSTEFRRHAPLPSWKHQTSGNLCLGLQGYLKSLILDPRAGQSEALAKFLDRENVGVKRKWNEVPVIGAPLWAVGAVHEGIEGVGKNTWKAIGSLAGPKTAKGNVNIPGTTYTPRVRPNLAAKAANVQAKSEESPMSGTSRNSLEEVGRANNRSPSKSPLAKEVSIPASAESTSGRPSFQSESETPANNFDRKRSISIASSKTSSKTFSRSEVDLVIDSGIAVIEEMYDLAGRQFNVRRTVLNLLRQVVRRSYSETVRVTLEGILEDQFSEVKIAETVKHLTDSFWPNGEWAGSATKTVRTEEDKIKTREEARALLIASVPDVLKITLGTAATTTAVNSLFELLQEEKLSRAIVTGLVLDFVRLFL